MSIGYACLTLGVLYTDQKSCLLKNASEAKLRELIAYNLNSLEKIIDYNIANHISLFRISSDLIPFGSSPVNKLAWWDIFAPQFQIIARKIKQGGIRVSMHPGQYTVLNSPHVEVVERAIEDLNYHTRVLDCLDVGAEHKIVLHIGGAYNDKKLAGKRFITNYKQLDNSVKQRLVLENDDKSYSINDVLEIASILNLPVVFDNLHNKINCFDKQKDDYYWIKQCQKTWQKKDGYQKIHYSQQDPLKQPGSHSNRIRINQFIDFYEKLESKEIDIMLEVKDKNLSAVKCINCTSANKTIKVLESEWSKYKYRVLDTSPNNYNAIRELLKNKNEYPAIAFYNLIEEALQKERVIGNSINAALHIWGYFKNSSSDKEKRNFFKNIDDYEQGRIPLKTLKNFLWKMAVKYRQTYLLNSYYFIIG